MIRKLFILLAFICSGESFGQAMEKKTIVGTAAYGVPHLFKNTTRLITTSQLFKEAFEGNIVVKDFGGVNPIVYKAEYAFNKYFGLGVSGGFFTMKFSVEDRYNVLKTGQVLGSDQVDTYKIKILSFGYGIRPNFHIPFKKHPNADLFFGLGYGFNKNKVIIDFSSTDVSKVYPGFKYDWNFGFVYFSPTMGYRQYFGEYIGLNFELGYDKGAILSGGLALRLFHKVQKPVEKVEEVKK